MFVDSRCPAILRSRGRLVRAHVALLAGVVDVCTAAASRFRTRRQQGGNCAGRARGVYTGEEGERIVSAVDGFVNVGLSRALSSVSWVAVT